MFILFPIGHDEDSVRRLPWVTIAILLACVAIQVFGIFTPGDAPWEIAAAEEGVRSYWVEHPYLELYPELRPEGPRWAAEDEWGPGGVREVRQPSDSGKREEQAQLDRLTDVWLAARDQIPIYRFGLIPVNPEIGDLFAHMFMHAGWLHLIGNMIFLWLTGPALEDVWGRPYFAALYLATGVFGGLVWTALHSSSAVPLVGASGAVAGLMGAFMVRYAKTPVKMFYLFFWIFPFYFRTGTFYAPAASMLGLWFANELLKAVFAGHSGVAFAIHVAGFLFGAAAALLIRRRRIEQKIAPKLDEKLGGDNLSNPAIEEAHELRQKGRHEQAWNMLAEEVRRRPGNLEAGMALWDVGMEIGRQPQAAPMFLRCIRSELRQGELELGLFHWYELVEQIPDTRIDLELRIRLAEAMLGSQRDEDAADLLADADSLLTASVPLGARIRLALYAARARSASAPALCAPLLGDPAVPDRLRRELAEADSGIKAFGLRPKPAAVTSPAPPPPAAPSPTSPAADEAPLPLADESPPNRVLKVMAAVPRRLTGDKLAVDVIGQGARTLPLSRIQGVAVGRIEEGFASNYVVIDLLVDSLWTDRPAVRTVRLRSTDFDPCEVLPALDGNDPLQALISFIDNLIEISSANPMPDPNAVRGRPFSNFVSVPDYEAQVIGFTSR